MTRQEAFVLAMAITECKDFNTVAACAFSLLDYAAALQDKDTLDMLDEYKSVIADVNKTLGRITV